MQTQVGDLRPGTAPRNIGREGDRTALAAAFNLAPMSLPRRDFLRHIGLFSAALWLGDDIMAQRYRSVLAQTTPRKLALLVGVDQYPRFASVPALKGCATDVELHCELLVHRFGFQCSDVLVLTAEAATRSNIEAAFATHLADQVRPGDIVVFHFSGYGCMVRTQPTGAPSYSDQKALLPIDSWVPNPIADQPPLFNGIYEDTLFLLLRTLKSNGVVTLLDLGVQPTLELRCRSLRERSLPLWTTTELSIAELILQERLLQQTQLTRDQIQAQRQAGQLPGLVLAAASDAQPTALERDGNQGAAGVFTSGLTQRLWDSSPATTLTLQFGQLAAQIQRQIGPAPQPTLKGQQSFGTLPSAMGPLPSASGIIQSIDRRGQLAKLWLGGLPSLLLEVLHPQSCFRGYQDPAPLMQLRSRKGWTAIAQYREGPPLQAGLPILEALRVLPRSIPLRLALGANLSRIERVDAISAIATPSWHLEIVSTDRPADYVLAKIPAQPDTIPPLAADRPLALRSTDSYGLAYLGGTLVPNTVGDRGEVIKLALGRLMPTLKVLLAMKWLELLLHSSATSLRMSIVLEQLGDPPQPLIQLHTGTLEEVPPPEGTPPPPMARADSTGKLLKIPSTTAIQHRIVNRNDFPVYVWVIGFNGTEPFASYATEPSGAGADQKPTLKPLVLAPKATVILPAAGQAWKASSGAGLTKTFFVCTRQPCPQTLLAQSNRLKFILANIPVGLAQQAEPLTIVEKLWMDLHQASASTAAVIGITSQDVWSLDTQEWAATSCIYATV